MKKLLEVSHTENENINQSVYELRKLSDGFYTTGNDSMGYTLFHIAGKVEESMKNLKGAVNEELDRALKQSQTTSNTILKTALAGIEVGKKHNL